MICNNNEPSAQSFTECAQIAAFYSSEREKTLAAVDYTKARYVKQPSGSKPGFVVYSKNYSAYVTADKETVDKLYKE
jgi:predicted ribosome quality control (RQC) complex YloA/Tae2 family protein